MFDFKDRLEDLYYEWVYIEYPDEDGIDPDHREEFNDAVRNTFWGEFYGKWRRSSSISIAIDCLVNLVN